MDGIEIVAYSLIGFVTSLMGIALLMKLINKAFFGAPTTPMAKQDPNVNKNEVKILHLDVHWLPNIMRMFKSDFAAERARALLTQVDKYDVVCLNEAFSYIGSPVASFIKEMRNRGFVYISRLPPARLFSMEVCDGGVIILSKLPIINHEFVIFDLNVGIDMVVGKGAVYARIQTGPGTHFHLYATNLQMNYSDSQAECTAVKFAQLREMMAKLRLKASDGQPIIVVGNLNMNGRAEAVTQGKRKSEYDRLFDTLSLDGYTIVDGMMQTFGEHLPTYGDEEATLTEKKDIGTKQRLDYIMMLNRDEGQYTITGQTTRVLKFEADGKGFTHLSNHYGLESEILFHLERENTV